MIQKKVCLVGSFAVGKTSLVRRFVSGMFSDRYLSTVGVKIDKKMVSVAGEDLKLILWDLAGEDEFQRVQISYLRGAAGYLLVIDGTRSNTVSEAERIQRRVEDEIGPLPFIVAANKSDLTDQWELDEGTTNELIGKRWTILRTSAKTGDGVEDVFQALAARLVEGG